MKDPLFSNKVAGAVLAALLLIFGLPQLTAALFGGAHHGGGHGDELHLAYGGDIELATAGGGETEAAPVVSLGELMANASVAGGERRAALCKSCHTFEEGGANGSGPNLWDIVNRPLASVAGFGYSSAVQDAGGVWSYDRLDAYLANSQEYIPGTAMVQRFARDTQRADILAYLGSLSANPAPFPEIPVVEEVVEEMVEATEEAALEAVVPVELAPVETTPVPAEHEEDAH